MMFIACVNNYVIIQNDEYDARKGLSLDGSCEPSCIKIY